VPSASTTDSAQALASGEPAFDTWRAVVKTVTYRVMVTTIDFGANYVEIGELVTTLALSSLALVDGPIPHFATSGLGTITAPPRGGEQGNGVDGFCELQGEPGFGQDGHLRSRDRGVGIRRQLSLRPRRRGRRGITTFSVVIAPIVYYVHERTITTPRKRDRRRPALALKRLHELPNILSAEARPLSRRARRQISWSAPDDSSEIE
jgi:uncharacterized membrane protein